VTVADPGLPFWVPSAALQRHLNRTATGNPDQDWLSHVRLHHLGATLRNVLVLNCGPGYLERALARHSGIERILSVDADPDAVARARLQAERLHLPTISYAVLDPERDGIPAGPWDAVLAEGLLHHVVGLEDLYARITAQLSPRGRVVFSDYTGPARFQHGEQTWQMVDRYFRLLPEHLRRDPESGRIAWVRERVDAARLARELPAEAARSEEILPLARRAFARRVELSGGGGLLHPLLSGFAIRFRAGEDERLLEVLCAAEADLAATGVAPAIFTVFVGERRDGMT
jgi:SAM-dependent methyltransferase